MLGLRPMCGYEIKGLVDNSTRFFWAASYGQIYPELRRLAEAGLIEGERDAAELAPAHRVHADRRGPRASCEGWLAQPAGGLRRCATRAC